MITENRTYILPSDIDMTPELLATYIGYHKEEAQQHYEKLMNAYCNDYAIFSEPEKEPYKPDNRISVNFAKYITDTLNGFFIGNPVKITCQSQDNTEDTKVNDYIQALDAYNSQDDNNSELSKMCSIFGHAYEYYYLDENSKIRITPVSPLQSFMIYTDEITPRPLFFVRYYTTYENIEQGQLVTDSHIVPFTNDGEIRFGEPVYHGFDELPATEYLENAERIGVFESVLPAIDAYNKALSEKANEVEYFSDSYLAILGANVDKAGMNFIRENRVINFPNSDLANIDVKFLERPSGDVTQENLLNRLEQKIYQISMVVNNSDDAFGTSSGEALKLKLRPMINLARTKERKFTAGMNRRYRVIFSNVYSEMNSDAWMNLQYKFTFDIPSNLSDEAATARNLVGIVSEETILKTLSCVADVKAEMAQLESEQEQSEHIQTEEPEDGSAG